MPLLWKSEPDIVCFIAFDLAFRGEMAVESAGSCEVETGSLDRQQEVRNHAAVWLGLHLKRNNGKGETNVPVCFTSLARR